MFDELAGDLIELFGRGVDAPLPDDEFDAWARRVFGFQFRSNPVYRRFCVGRGVEPDRLESWMEIPAVPTRAFKRLPLVSGDPDRVEAVFRTSGTSLGPGKRGEHRVRSLALYRASLLPSFRAHLLPDDARLPALSLVPSPEAVPDSSLSRMIGVVFDELADGGEWVLDPEGGIREDALRGALAEAEAEGRPLLILSTAFALVHWIDAMDREGWRFRLPEGSRIMETGGFKGRSRTLERGAFYRALEERLGVPAHRIVNEYGMTELLSQFYEPVMREGRSPADAVPSDRRHVAPPWVRTRVLDPGDLSELPPGEPGLLSHLDLANAGSVAAVLTEDMGVEVGEGFRVLGRAAGAEPRGCSLAMDELLGAAEEGR
ncbi:MAG: long-chain fatty acid--CoA ligase [Gemmatimonadetes bacterium]|nr:long-chain fatty acid--CoA ligase [Gemmatimonadota bacterium]NIR80857.1 long-chain fatty acid--CoA ligase [Gemmatimonadota bacterium]NIT89676.1 long-chain fatty acid--CoA ligase [Gemmatimonadota bacterium]NIU33456.1 long-chain fatty acid--CoA ligase [Gemmatimonadota bacterium]NIU37742.1 long-chain fatty acid--CoA ligase [Gemmatimonadota bacterium]